MRTDHWATLQKKGGLPLKRSFFFCLLLAAMLPVLGTAAKAENTGQTTIQKQEITFPIVMYHHLSEDPSLLGDYVLSVDQLEQDLIYLKEHGYTSITTKELIDWCNGTGTLPEKPVMITFDDGYESTGVYALPLLKKYGMHGIMSIIGAVAQQFTDQPDHNLRYSHLNWDAITELTSDPDDALEVQCHTYNMHHLSPRKGCTKCAGESKSAYYAALTQDLNTFQTQFAQHTGQKTNALALPFGSYTKDTIEIAEEAGFQMIFTCTEQVNHLTGDPKELLELCRFNRPHGPDSASFFSKWEP